MRWWAIVWCVLTRLLLLVASARAADGDINPRLKTQVEQIVSELSDANQAVREAADVKLRNLPLPAYPMVTAIYALQKEALDAEARSRIDSSLEMFKALAAIDQLQRKYFTWMNAHSLQAYDQSSSRDSKWDQPAREAISIATTWSPQAAQIERMKICFAKATEAGCDDPLFLYHYAQFYSTQGAADDRKTLDLMREALLGVRKRFPYPAWVKCLLACQAQALLLRRQDLQNTELERPDSANVNPLEFFEQIKPQDDLPDQLLYEMADLISRQHGNTGAKYYYDKLAEPFGICAADPVYLQVLKATCDARDGLRRDGVDVEVQDQHLAAAQAELEKAYRMDRQLPFIPTELMRLLFWRGAQREEIDLWFKRAMAVNPDDFQACLMMLEALPAKEKLEFGRQCLAGQNWRGRLPIILVEAHEAVGNAVDDKNEYWQQPQVWHDIQHIYETYLALYPDSVEDRSNYALLANRCRQWVEADRQFNILGEKPSLKVFGSMTSYNYQRKKAARNALQ